MRFARGVTLLLCLPALSLAQNISAALSGTVTDSLGAVFPGLGVSVSNTQTGFAFTTRTNGEGFFSFPDLTPGTYSLQIATPGFKKYTQSGIALSSSEQRSLGAIRLELGDVADSVTVTAEAAPVQLGSSERAGVLTNDDIESMALRGRDFVDAVGLLPGVVDTSERREAPAADSIGGIFIMGGRSNQKNVTVDGVTNLDTGSNGSMHNMPSMDAIGEVKVLMSNYAAEYGRNSGGSITVITKGGGKQFHGTLGWYHRHENYSANEFFNNRNGLERPPYRYNIASYTVSGPIYWPGRFNRDRSRLFFFWSQEFQREKRNYGTRQQTVPTPLEREGDFSQTLDVNGRLRPVYDPLVGRVAFPGNIVPKSRQIEVGRRILDLFPLPNFTDPEPVRRYQWNYITSLSGPYPKRNEVLRTDWQPRADLTLYFRYSHNLDEEHVPYGTWVAGSVNFPLTPILYRRPGRGGTVHGTWTMSPTFFNQFIFGLSQNKLYFHPEFPERVSRKGTGIDLPQWNTDINPGGLLPNMTFSSVQNYANPSLSNDVPYYNSNTIFSFVDNLSKVAGTHMLKFGVYIERTRKDQSAGTTTRGALAFDADRNNPLDSNYAYASALMGIYTRYSESNARPQGLYRFTNFEWYAQDAWRLRRSLLVDFGVRFYRNLPQYDARNQLASFVPGLWDAAKAPVLLRPAYNAARKKVALDPLSGREYSETLIGTFVPGVGNPSDGMVVAGRDGWPRGMYEGPGLALAPRIGFAWDPFGRGRTAIRGGGGVFFDRIQGNPTMGLLKNPPTVLTPTVYFGYLSQIGENAGKGILAPSSATGMIGQHPMPTVYNFSFGVQQQIGRRIIADVSFVGSISRHFLWQREVNAIPIGAQHYDLQPENLDPTTGRAFSANFLRPLQGWGSIEMFEFASTASYNSLQASVQRRMYRGIQIGLAYTFSKVLGTAASDTTNVSAFFDPRRRNYGPLSHDRTHVASLRYNWILPRLGRSLHSRMLGRVTDGWEISGISRFMTGAPFTPGYSLVSGTDITGTSTEGARINVLDPNAHVLKGRFGPPQRGSFGNAGVGILRQPGMNNWDISLFRTMKVGDRRTAQLRLETYNTFNHTQFNSLNTTARFDAQANQIDPTFLEPRNAYGPRRVQLALRVNW